MDGTVLLERDAEITRIERVLDAASAGEGSVTAISGEAGVGKTALLEAAVRGSRSVGVRPLLARASELERDFTFGVVRQLLEPAVLGLDPDARADAFSGAAAAASTALDLDSSPDLERDALTSLHGLYWLVVNLSVPAPLLLAVDDLQWADEMSLRALAYLARRLEGVPIALVATLRTGEDLSEAAALAIDEIHGRAETARVAPIGLGDGAVSELLASELGSEPDPAFAATCRELTGGNPFLVTELAAELTAEGVQPTAGNRARVEAIVPDRVGQMVRRHLARLDPEARSLARAVAIVGDGEELQVAGEMAGLEPAGARSAAGELISARVLADDQRLRFRHPLLRAAVEEEIPGPERAAGHGEAARILARAGAAPARVAPHLLLSPPGAGDEWVVDQLRAAARSARSQGAADQAARFLGRALEEPPPDEMRGEVLEEAADAEFRVLRPTAASRFAEAREHSRDPAKRARLGLGEGMAHYYASDHQAAVAALTSAADEAKADSSAREEWLILEAFLGLAGRYDLGTKDEVEERTAALARTLGGETPGERLILAFVAGLNPAGTAELLVSATDMDVATYGTAPWPQPAEGVGAVAMYVHAGRPEKAFELADRLAEQATEEASPLKHAMAVGARSLVSLDVGDLRSSSAEVQDAAAVIEELGAGLLVRGNAAIWVGALAEMGETTKGEELLERHDLLGELPEQMIFNPMLFWRSQLRVAQRRIEEADADLAELGRRQERWGMLRPSPPWRSARALTLSALGNDAGALELAREELAVATRWNTPKSIAVAKRALGRLAEGDEALGHLSEALELLRDGPWRLDRARVRVDLGAALRRRGERRRGRELLTEAMDEAHAIGAAPLAELAAEELRASGARPRKRAVSGLDALTPSELRVARLAAEGRSNREIAQELFVTMATVETHLTRTYRKLDLDGREGLAEALGATDPTGPAP